MADGGHMMPQKSGKYGARRVRGCPWDAILYSKSGIFQDARKTGYKKMCFCFFCFSMHLEKCLIYYTEWQMADI